MIVEPVAILTQITRDLEEGRASDVADCILDNLANEIVDEVHLFVIDKTEPFMEALSTPETSVDFKLRAIANNPKVRLNHHGKTPTFSEYFNYANERLADRIAVVSSPDIAFDGTVMLLGKIDLSDYFVCLSRDNGTGGPGASVSQDAWIFRAPLKKLDVSWPIGTLGGDNRIAYLAWKAGYAVINPCRSILAKCKNTIHANRWHGDRINGPYLEVHPIGIESVRIKS